MKNIILIVADSLRRDTSDSIVAFPENLPIKHFDVTACNSSTALSLPWMLSGMEVFSPTMSIPTDLKKLGYYTVMINSNPVVSRFSAPFDLVIDLGRKEPVTKKLRRYHRITRYIPNAVYKLFIESGTSTYLPYARVEKKLEAFESLPRDKPLFVWLHLMDPHTPYYPEGEQLDEVIRVNRNQMSAVRGYHIPHPVEVKRWYELYRLESSFMYWKLLSFFDSLDYSENTVIFTSDHGEEFGEHGEYGHKGNRFNSENVEVPFIVFGENMGSLSITSHKSLRELVKMVVNQK